VIYSHYFFPVETPSIMLLAALRNIRIVRVGCSFNKYMLDVKHPHDSGFKLFSCTISDLHDYSVFPAKANYL
jgi:hypothetical protein